MEKETLFILKRNEDDNKYQKVGDLPVGTFFYAKGKLGVGAPGVYLMCEETSDKGRGKLALPIYRDTLQYAVRYGCGDIGGSFSEHCPLPDEGIEIISKVTFETGDANE